MAKSAGPVTTASVYDDGVVRAFALAAVLWGVVGMLVGVIIASQLTWPELNFGIPWLSYGRLRPLHTNAVIFAFGGCGLGLVHVLGLATGDPGCGNHAPAGFHPRQGIC